MHYMHYEINISKDGRHFFATAPRSVQDKTDLKKVLPVLTEAFKAVDGYEISVTRHHPCGETLGAKDLQELLK